MTRTRRAVQGPGSTGTSPGSRGAGGPHGGHRSVGRVIGVVVGAVLLLISTGLLAGGTALLWADRTQRDDGFVWTETSDLRTSTYALVSDSILLDTAGADRVRDDFLGRARIEVTDTHIFVGVAPSRAVAAYLSGVGHHRVNHLRPRWDGGMGPGMMTGVEGGAPRGLPADSDIWVDESTGSGTRVLDWRPQDGDWTVVVMRVDGRAGLAVDVRGGVTAAGLGALGSGLLGVGAALLVGGALLVALAVHRAQRSRGPGVAAPPPPLPTPRAGESDEARPAPTTAERG